MSEAVATPQSKYWNEDKKKFVSEETIRDRDGNIIGPKQYFEADTLEELLDKKNAAHLNAAASLYETRRAARISKLIEPDREFSVQTFEEKQLSADDRVKLTKMITDPANAPEAWNAILEAKFGAPVEVIRENFREIEMNRQIARIKGAIDTFKQSHPEYVECSENKQKIEKYLEKENLPWTVKNLEIAFDELCSDGKMLLRANQQKAPDPTPVAAQPAPAAPAVVAAIPPQPTPAPEIPATPPEVRPRQSASGLGRDNASTPKVVRSEVQALTRQDIINMPTPVYMKRLQTDPEFAKRVSEILKS